MSVLIGLLAAGVVTMIGIRLAPLPARLQHAPADGSARTAQLDPSTASLARRQLIRRARRTAAVVAVAMIAGPFVAGAIVAAAQLVPRVRTVRTARRHRAAITVAYPDFVDLLVLTITSGCSPSRAMATIAPVAPEPVQPAVDAVVASSALGVRFADAVAALHRDPPGGLGAIARPLSDALALADRHGTPLAPVLDRLAGEARAQRRRNAETAARQLPIRLAFPLVGCTLPSFVLLTIVPLMAGSLSSLRGLSP